MLLTREFEVARGTTAGRSHRTGQKARNNQDAVLSRVTDELIVGTLADGCSSQPHSELGAHHTVLRMLRGITRYAKPGEQLDAAWFGQLYKNLVNHLHTKARDLSLTPSEEDIRAIMNDYMMATAGGVIMTPATTYFFGTDEWFLVINDEVIIWRTENKNYPKYPLMSLAYPGDPSFAFRTLAVPTANIRTCLMGTDGMEDLLEACASDFDCIPGTADTPVGPISQIWANDDFYNDPDAVDTWLNSLARDRQHDGDDGPEDHGGLLSDDTTLFAIRRMPEE